MGFGPAGPLRQMTRKVRTAVRKVMRRIDAPSTQHVTHAGLLDDVWAGKTAEGRLLCATAAWPAARADGIRVLGLLPALCVGGAAAALARVRQVFGAETGAAGRHDAQAVQRANRGRAAVAGRRGRRAAIVLSGTDALEG